MYSVTVDNRLATDAIGKSVDCVLSP